MMSLFVFLVMSILVSGCTGLDSESKPKNITKRPASYFVEHNDIFNLKWGMKKNECFRICDWGGKSDDKYSVPDGVHVLKFKKGEVFADLGFNDNDELYKVTMMSFFASSQLDQAKDFYFYLDNILRGKYTPINSPADRKMFNRTFKCIYISMYVNSRSIVSLLLYHAPTKKNGIDFVLDLTYFSKKIKSTHIPEKDAAGM